MQPHLSLTSALRRALDWRPILSLYLTGLLLGMIQLWPLLQADGLAYNPIVRDVLANPIGGLVDAGTSGFGEDILLGGGIWMLVAVLLTPLLGLAYAVCAGGALNRWLVHGSFGAGCVRYGLPFIGLSVLVALLGAVAIAIGAGVGVLAGGWAGAATAIVLLQYLNLAGESGRTTGVLRARRNPFVLLGYGLAAPFRHPALLLVALAGLTLHAALAAAFNALNARSGGYGALALGQFAVLGWIIIKLLRLSVCAWVISRETKDQGPKTEVNTVRVEVL